MDDEDVLDGVGSSGFSAFGVGDCRTFCLYFFGFGFSLAHSLLFLLFLVSFSFIYGWFMVFEGSKVYAYTRELLGFLSFSLFIFISRSTEDSRRCIRSFTKNLLACLTQNVLLSSPIHNLFQRHHVHVLTVITYLPTFTTKLPNPALFVWLLQTILDGRQRLLMRVSEYLGVCNRISYLITCRFVERSTVGARA